MPMTILAVPTDPRTARACLDAAATAARVDPTSGIIVLHVRTDPESLILPTEEVMTERRREQLEADARSLARSIHAVFDEWERDAGMRAAWDEVVGTVQAEVTSHGKAADLVVLARPLAHEGHEALHTAIFETGRLLLHVPPSTPRPFGKHVGIAWKECDQAKAAVAAALPWLRRAERVSVIAVGSDGPPDQPRELIDMLDNDGVRAEPVLLSSDGETPGAQILKQALAIDVDCIVMGAYRHGELIERLLGGVTRHMLQLSDLPLLLHH